MIDYIGSGGIAAQKEMILIGAFFLRLQLKPNCVRGFCRWGGVGLVDSPESMINQPSPF